MNASQEQQQPQYPDGPLLGLLALSISVTVAGRVADNLWLTWGQVCQAFRDSANRLSSTKDGMLICFAQFANDYRLTSIATDIYAVCLDFDHGTTEQLLASLALAQRLSTRGIVHTTWSDAPVHLDDPDRIGGDRCWRVIIPLDMPVGVVVWSRVWHNFANAFRVQAGATADTQCKNINRRYYVPMAKQHVDHPTLNQDGTYTGATPATLWTWGE